MKQNVILYYLNDKFLNLFSMFYIFDHAQFKRKCKTPSSWEFADCFALNKGTIELFFTDGISKINVMEVDM